MKYCSFADVEASKILCSVLHSMGIGSGWKKFFMTISMIKIMGKLLDDRHGIVTNKLAFEGTPVLVHVSPSPTSIAQSFLSSGR